MFEKVANKDEFIHKCEKWVESAILSEKVELTNQHEFLTFIHELYIFPHSDAEDKIRSNCTKYLLTTSRRTSTSIPIYCLARFSPFIFGSANLRIK